MKKVITIISVCILTTSLLCARDISITVKAGAHWKEKREPQCAIWLEDTQGNYISTLYVTERASKKNWIMGPAQGRPESLPVWYHTSNYAAEKKTKKRPATTQFDAVTSATPKGNILSKRAIVDTACVIKAEFNTSFDYNESYTKKNAGVNGQPSVIYQALIPQEATGNIPLSFAGTGTLNGSDGVIHTQTEGLTTATTIVDSISISFSK
ncbi:MAG: DUF2271 domain-containing protein [Treponema sp.]|nr:DUF2271 domain-containing protein [Treponema sp.]